MLTSQQQASYSEQGYLVFPELFAPEQMSTLRKRCQ